MAEEVLELDQALTGLCARTKTFFCTDEPRNGGASCVRFELKGEYVEKRRGFTMIEGFIVIAIIGVIIAILLPVIGCLARSNPATAVGIVPTEGTKINYGPISTDQNGKWAIVEVIHDGEKFVLLETATNYERRHTLLKTVPLNK
jgi:prepilin-type N-terminal cleavage/methylation domain-containing protein